MPRRRARCRKTQFAALVDALAADPARRDELNALLREQHPHYDQRGAATIVRMRGWVLLALARAGVSDADLIFVLEELESGLDPYLVAAAARALRSYPSPNETFAPFVMRALTNIRYHDEPISFESYGEYAVAATGTSPVRELLATLAWLGPHAAGVLDEVRLLRKQGSGLPARFRVDIDRAIQAIRGPERSDPPAAPACCGAPATGVERTSSWPPNERRSCAPVASAVLQDHDGATITFKEFFTRTAGHRRFLLYPLRQSAEVLADRDQACPRAGLAAGAGTGRAYPYRGDHLRSGVSICPSACASMERTGVCVSTRTIACCARPTATTRCASTSRSASISSSRW